MPKGRTLLYVIWRVCERFNILPSGVKESFDDNLPLVQARLISYENIREIEEAESDLKGL